ncbi:hypothetical protein INT45_007936 [Circinella minor]|uniref:Uncharacterized protein n=1 Tax=Circinella minor TaxID=1195481 RepID=A0A8H7VJ26_9FUNG|nr:hypothetical protein INT45_007936 [Circinella minor]
MDLTTPPKQNINNDNNGPQILDQPINFEVATAETAVQMLDNQAFIDLVTTEMRRRGVGVVQDQVTGSVFVGGYNGHTGQNGRPLVAFGEQTIPWLVESLIPFEEPPSPASEVPLAHYQAPPPPPPVAFSPPSPPPQQQQQQRFHPYTHEAAQPLDATEVNNQIWPSEERLSVITLSKKLKGANRLMRLLVEVGEPVLLLPQYSVLAVAKLSKTDFACNKYTQDKRVYKELTCGSTPLRKFSH